MQHALLKKFTLVFGILAMVLYVPYIVKAVATDCSVYTNSAVPEGYAPPISFFGPSGLIVKMMCDGTTSFQLTAGSGDTNELVYKVGYWYDGREWKQLTLDGNPRGGDPNSPWLVGTGSASIATPLSGRNYVVAYVCTSSEGVWKCGCTTGACATSKWQLQAFNNDNGGDDGGGGSDCEGGSGNISQLGSLPNACIGEPYSFEFFDCPDFGPKYIDDRAPGSTRKQVPPGMDVKTFPVESGRNRAPWKHRIFGIPSLAGTYDIDLRFATPAAPNQETQSCRVRTKLTVLPSVL